jgi:membrane fusion protein (multidrug efflux system)
VADDETPSPKAARPGLRQRLRTRAHDHPVRVTLELIVFCGVLVGVVLYWLHARHFEDTDDAQIDAHISPVGARIEGTVTAVHVDDNQWVAAGDPLVDLDPRDYEVALERAEAQEREARAQLEATHPNLPIVTTETATQVSNAADEVADLRAAVAAAERNAVTAAAQLREAEATDTRAQADVTRYEYLLKQDAVTPERRDERIEAGRVAHAAVEARRAAQHAALAAVEQQRARLSQSLHRKHESDRNAPFQVAIRSAQVAAAEQAAAAAQANLDQARLNLGYTRIVAPIDGIVGRRSAEPGARVLPGQVLLQVVDMSHLWVTANYKETQLKKIRVGQHVHIHVDAYNQDLGGTVESMPGATGARFSLLPPENAVGNYVKVVQRLPVRIRIDARPDAIERLRPGMSVEPRVDLRTTLAN